MIRLIARKDFLEFRRDGRLYWAGGVVVLLLLTALAVGSQRQHEVNAERILAQELDYHDWVHQDHRHPHDAAHQGMHVFKPEPALSMVDPGINPYAGATVWLQAHRQSEVKFRPAQDATGLQRFGDLSAAWVLQVLGPLLVIVLGFNAFAGEREQGTLRQTMSIGVAPRQLLWGKALAIAACLLVLMAPAAIASAIAVAAGAESGARFDGLLRLVWLGIGYAFYFGIFIFVVLAVSAASRSSRTALIILLGLWIAVVMMAPRMVSDFSRVLHPSPSKFDFSAELSEDLSAEYERAWIENFGVSTRFGTEVPLDKWGIALQVDDHASYGVLDLHYGRLWDTFDRQKRVQEWAGLLVPILAVRAFSMGMAGTDLAHHREFTQAAERHRRVMQDMMSEDLVMHADPLGNQHFEYQAGPELWAAVPQFQYATPSISWALKHNFLSILILGAGFLFSFLLARSTIVRQRSV